MTRVLVEHIRRNVIAYLALTCSLLALSGVAYASLRIPVGAVGERQIRNQVIDPVKWDPAYVTGFVRRWANVSASGSILSGSPNAQSVAAFTGDVVVTWHDAFAGFCAAIATVQGGSTAPPPTVSARAKATTATTTTATTSTPAQEFQPGGYADASIEPVSGGATLVAVETYNSFGQPTAEPFAVAIICPRGAGSGQTFPTTLP